MGSSPPLNTMIMFTSSNLSKKNAKNKVICMYRIIPLKSVSFAHIQLCSASSPSLPIPDISPPILTHPQPLSLRLSSAVFSKPIRFQTPIFSSWASGRPNRRVNAGKDSRDGSMLNAGSMDKLDERKKKPFQIFFENANLDILVQTLYIFFDMKRNSLKKASTFKLQAARARFHHYLSEIHTCPVVQRHPSHLEEIRSASETVFDYCYSFREDSPFLRGLNYDNRYFGFHLADNRISLHEYLGDVASAHLLGDFNAFHPSAHPLLPDPDLGHGWFSLDFDLNQFRLEEGTRLQLRVGDADGKIWTMPPPSCRVVEGDMGFFRRECVRAQGVSKHRYAYVYGRIGHLLAYTIDLEQLPLEKCLGWVEAEMDLLQCFNTIILKNLFPSTPSLLHKFSLAPASADLLDDLTHRLALAGLKVVVEWNFESGGRLQLNPVEQQYLCEAGNAEWQFDLKKEPVLAFYLANISHYFRQFGIGGIHFSKVHRVCHHPNGPLLARTVNLLCERLSETSVTLASSREVIVGVSEPILQGGLGFGFSYNFHESLSLSQQHESIYATAKQIHASSNCLSLDFTTMRPQDCTYLLFTFLISKRGIFTRGPLRPLAPQLTHALHLRRQEELFTEDPQLKRIDADCVVIQRGQHLFLFNFEEREVDLEVPAGKWQTIFNEREVGQETTEGGTVRMAGNNCLVLQQA